MTKKIEKAYEIDGWKYVVYDGEVYLRTEDAAEALTKIAQILKDEISLCNHCHCMTKNIPDIKTLKNKCGKCHEIKT